VTALLGLDGRHDDADAVVVVARRAGAEAVDAAPLQAEALAGDRTGRDARPHGPVHRRHLDLRAEVGLGDAHRDVGGDVVAVAAEIRVRLDGDREVEVAALGPPLPRHADARTGVDACGNADRQALRLDERARAVAGRAGRLRYVPGPAAAGAAARNACRERNGATEDGIAERDGDGGGGVLVLAEADPGASPREEVGKEIGNVSRPSEAAPAGRSPSGRRLAEVPTERPLLRPGSAAGRPGGGLGRFAGVSEAVVTLLLPRILEDLVGGRDLLEALVRSGVAEVHVRVGLPREAPVRLLDLRVARRA